MKIEQLNSQKKIHVLIPRPIDYADNPALHNPYSKRGELDLTPPSLHGLIGSSKEQTHQGAIIFHALLEDDTDLLEWYIPVFEEQKKQLLQILPKYDHLLNNWTERDNMLLADLNLILSTYFYDAVLIGPSSIVSMIESVGQPR